MLLMKVLKCWKTVEFPNISIKKSKTENHSLRKSFSPHPPNKNFLCLCNKIFFWRFAEMYRHLISKCFENAVFGCIEMVQCKCFIWHQFVKWVRLLALLLEYIFYNIEWDEPCKMNFFERNCIVLVSCLRFSWITNSSDHSRVWMNYESLAYEVVT